MLNDEESVGIRFVRIVSENWSLKGVELRSVVYERNRSLVTLNIEGSAILLSVNSDSMNYKDRKIQDGSSSNLISFQHL